MPLTLSKTHDTTITIDDEPVHLHVRRMDRAEAIAFEREYRRFGSTRGSTESTEEDKQAARDFIAEAIVKYVTVEPGDILDDGTPVVSGNDLIRSFGSRGDVLQAFYVQIYMQNFLGKDAKKNLSALPFLSPGSQPKSPRLDGDRPEPTAASAESSNSATPEAATASSASTTEDEPESSGAKVH